ncbi:hypothetical protein DPMN_191929 [Dreissena polymorpha]|uniref:Uncharacterized protein n=1 Tax=Dreissena polymorpha TaxID=45954 RepID=A0A9D3Y2A5_DREPO|nr:hypothetical protein DPMN_191929 [Dreissena polymorpha]
MDSTTQILFAEIAEVSILTTHIVQQKEKFNYCHKLNHFKAVCRKRRNAHSKVHEIHRDTESGSEADSNPEVSFGLTSLIK